jgi:hypothetical protein
VSRTVQIDAGVDGICTNRYVCNYIATNMYETAWKCTDSNTVNENKFFHRIYKIKTASSAINNSAYDMMALISMIVSIAVQGFGS